MKLISKKNHYFMSMEDVGAAVEKYVRTAADITIFEKIVIEWDILVDEDSLAKIIGAHVAITIEEPHP